MPAPRHSVPQRLVMTIKHDERLLAESPLERMLTIDYQTEGGESYPKPSQRPDRSE
jgi:hypothetical protein